MPQKDELQWSTKTKQQAVEGVFFSSRSAKLDTCCMILPPFPRLVKGQQWALHLHPLMVPKEVVRFGTFPSLLPIAVHTPLRILQQSCGIQVLNDLPREGSK